MEEYKIIGVDLAKTKFHMAGTDATGKIVMRKALRRDEFMKNLWPTYKPGQIFAFEACCGAHYMGQFLRSRGYEAVALRPKDVKAYAKSRQKNDTNDAIAICKATLDPDIRHVHLKSREEQMVSYLHKTRQNVIRQRIQRSNSIMMALQEFGFVFKCGKSAFARHGIGYIEEAREKGYVDIEVYEEMVEDYREIVRLLTREQMLDKKISVLNKRSPVAQLLETIPGIGPINASILSNKAMNFYDTPKDFAASLGLVPKQNTTGGKIVLGRITKQGDRYARTMLIQAARSLVMRSHRGNCPQNALYDFINRLMKKKKKYNVVCVAVANKLARLCYACATRGVAFEARYHLPHQAA